MARVTPGLFIRRPEQPPAKQFAAQAEYLNRLRDWIVQEVEQREGHRGGTRPGMVGAAGGRAAAGPPNQGGPRGGPPAPRADDWRDRVAVDRRADPTVRGRVRGLAERLAEKWPA